MLTPPAAVITRLALRNFRSIAGCDVALGPLTFLVGRNGAGKGNFLDALRFVADSLRYSMEQALRDRGGIREVRRRSNGHPRSFGIRIEFDLTQCRGHLAFEVAAKTDGGYEIGREECAVSRADDSACRYSVKNGVVSSDIPCAPAPAAGQLYLVRASGEAAFRPVLDLLAEMRTYDLEPEAMRRTRLPASERLLMRDGRNIAGVLFRLEERSPEDKRRIEEYLGSVVDGVVGVKAKRFGPQEGLEFRLEDGGGRPPRRFHAAGMSDGTLRALGVFTALFQSAGNGESRRLVGIEEPESALHPSADGALLDALRESSGSAQVLMTTHGADLLDDKDLAADELLAVEARGGRTLVGPIDAAGRAALRDRLCAPGELLRLGRIRPDPKTAGRAFARKGLFDRNSRSGGTR